MRCNSWMQPSLIFLVSFVVKEYKIEKGNFVTWDEAHFGKFSQKYLDREFYFDVHPPLGKMLTALSGFIFGQSKDFEFSSKDSFPSTFDYVGMRRFHALISSFVAVIAYYILRAFHLSSTKSFLLSLIFIFDNGLTSISRLILLDSHLLAFTAATSLAAVKLWSTSRKLQPGIETKNYSSKETKWLLFLGISLGCTLSIKWIGCLTMLFVGIFIIFDLLQKLLFLPVKKFFNFFLKRLIFLIILPALIYILLFYIHFNIVNKSGKDDDFMSTGFQLRLKNNPFEKIRKYISYGKIVTIKSASGGHLHSHLHEYPDNENKINNNEVSKNKVDKNELKSNEVNSNEVNNGENIMSDSNQLNNKITNESDDSQSNNYKITNESNESQANNDDQNDNKLENSEKQDSELQVTIYGARDQNNNFFFQKVTDNKETTFVRHNDRIALLHSETKAYISWNDKNAILSEGKRAVAKQGSPTQDSVWIVELYDGDGNLEALKGKFYLKNEESGQYLSVSGKNYPKWGFGQGEVFCSAEKNDQSLWMIEENFYTDDEEKNPIFKDAKLGFWKSLVEHHIIMFNTNKSFAHNPDLNPDRIVSAPYEWPLLTRGLRMSQWDDNHKFYMFMNPLLHYSSTLSVILGPLIFIIKFIKLKRRKKFVLAGKGLFYEEKVLEKINKKRVRLERETFYEKQKINKKSVKLEKGSFYDVEKEKDRSEVKSEGGVFSDDEKAKENIKNESKLENKEFYTEKILEKIKKEEDKLEREAFFIFTGFLGWCVHYFAFFFVGRVLYLHHYFPALFFALLCLCYCLKDLKTKYIGVIVSGFIICYALYSPLTYGFLSQEAVKFLKIIPSWDFID